MPKPMFPAAGSGLPSSSPRIPAGKSATILTERRGFLRALAGLPLIGGGVTLIGQPTAVAEPVTIDLLEAYKTWLHYELRFLCWEMADDRAVIALKYPELAEATDRGERYSAIKSRFEYVGQSGSYHPAPLAASTRAALVLSAVGCDWRGCRND